MLYLPFGIEDVVTHGQLLTIYRTARGLEQRDVSQLLADSSTTPWAISRLENDQTARPSPHRERQLAFALHLRYQQYTSLLRAADIELTPPEVLAMRGQVMPLIAGMSAPAFLADSRGTVWAANAAFEQRFGPLTVPGNTPVSGSPGISFFALLFSRHSNLRSAFDEEQWQALARTQLGRFWLTSRRLIRDKWGGRPQWLDDQLTMLAQLPDGDGKLFSQLWHEAQQEAPLEAAAGPSAGEGEFVLPGSATELHLRGAAAPALVLPAPLTDTRFGLRVIHGIQGT